LFVEARRSGLLELWLSTPLTTRQIVQGQWRAMLRLFGLPMGLCLLTQWVGAVMVQHLMWGQLAGAAPAATTAPPTAPLAVVTNTVTTGSTVITTGNPVAVQVVGPGAATIALAGFKPPGLLVAVALAFASSLTTSANLVALVWFGLWMGLTSKNTNLATLKTILFVQVIPWFGIAFLSALAVPLLLLPKVIGGSGPPPGQMMVWFPILSAAVAMFLYLAKNAVFLLYARSRLLAGLRQGSL
jgi:hypothetical protein